MHNDVFLKDYRPDNKMIARWKYKEISKEIRVYYHKERSGIQFHALIAEGIIIKGDGKDHFWQADRTFIRCLLHGCIGRGLAHVLESGHEITHNRGKIYGSLLRKYKNIFETLEGFLV